MTVSAPDRPKIPIYVDRDAEGETTNHIIMAKTKNEEKQMGENIKSKKKKIRLDILFHLSKKNFNNKSLEGRFHNKIQTAKSGIESTVKTDTGKTNNRNFINHYFGPRRKHEKSWPSIPTARSIRKTGTASEVLMANTADRTKYSVT